MATPNYGYEKRQRELAKKQKKLDKERAKAQRKSDLPASEDASHDVLEDGPSATTEAPSPPLPH